MICPVDSNSLIYISILKRGRSPSAYTIGLLKHYAKRHQACLGRTTDLLFTKKTSVLANKIKNKLFLEILLHDHGYESVEYININLMNSYFGTSTEFMYKNTWDTYNRVNSVPHFFIEFPIRALWSPNGGELNTNNRNVSRRVGVKHVVNNY